VRASLTRNPHLAHATRPVGPPGKQTPSVELVGRNALRRRRDLRWRSESAADCGLHPERPPERRVDFERRTGLRLDLIRIVQQNTAESLERDTASRQVLAHPHFELRRPGLVASRAMDEFSPGLCGEVREDVCGIAMPQDQTSTKIGNRARQSSKASMQPPARRSSARPGPLGLLVEDENGNDRSAFGDRRHKCGMVFEPEIAAKPNDDRLARQRMIPAGLAGNV
jgi:hypothetical protein